MGSMRWRERGAAARMAASFRRAARKHRLALTLCGLALFFLFVPSLFLGRVLSPNDLLYVHDPWRTLREIEPQNPLLNDPASSWYGRWALLKTDPAAFHWSRYVGGGVPGLGSVASAVISPVILIPVLLVPLIFSYSAIIAAKLLVSFGLAYGWLREERLGRRAAALGALVFSCAGIYSVWWLWQSTNATVFYPAVFWMIARAFSGKRTPMWAAIFVAFALAVSGYPATTLYVAWAGALYAIWLAVRERALPRRELSRLAAAALLAVAIASPFVAPYVSLLKRSGYLEARATVAQEEVGTYPAGHLRAFVDPFRLGNPGERLWIGDPDLGPSDNFVESTIYVGLATLPLALLGSFRRHRARWFWAGASVLLLVLMFGAVGWLSAAAGELPGIRYSPLARLRFLVPVPAAFLAASGAGILLSRLRRARPSLATAAGWLVGAALLFDLVFFAVRFYPYIPPDVAAIPETPTIRFLRAQQGPFRVAPFFDFLWPNTAELMKVEDIRSHFGSEARWRAMLERFAPGSFGGSGTVIQFNSLSFDLRDPLLSALNVRWLIEQPTIDILRWKILEGSEMSEPLEGSVPLRPGTVLTQQIVSAPGMRAADLNFNAVHATAPGAAIDLELIRPETGKAVWKRRLTAPELAALPKVYVPTGSFAGSGDALLIRITSRAIVAEMPRGASGQFVWGRSFSPFILTAVLPDGRLFENLDALSRFNAVWNVRAMPFEAMLADRTIDFRTESVLTGGSGAQRAMASELGSVPEAGRAAALRLREYTGARATIDVQSAVPFFFASSEKLTPELGVSVDGRRIEPLEINGVFAGFPLPAGSHRIVFERRVGRGWWPLFFAGAVAGAIAVALDGRGRRKPGSGPYRFSATKMN